MTTTFVDECTAEELRIQASEKEHAEQLTAVRKTCDRLATLLLRLCKEGPVRIAVLTTRSGQRVFPAMSFDCKPIRWTSWVFAYPKSAPKEELKALDGGQLPDPTEGLVTKGKVVFRALDCLAANFEASLLAAVLDVGEKVVE